MKKILALLATTAAFSTASAANFMSAATLLRDLNSSDIIAKSMAIGYVVGVTDSLEVGQKICIPAPAKYGEPAYTVLPVLEKAPAHLLQMKAPAFIGVVLTSTWPCNK